MELKGPLFSIIIPIYNADKTLSSTIESILSQTYNDWELLLVDDCSTDSSYVVAKNYAKKDARIRAYQILSNSGSARKPCDFGVTNAKGKLCLFIGNDDVISQDYLASMEVLSTKADVIIPTTMVKDLDMKAVEYLLPKSNIDTTKIYTGKEACLLTLPTWQICCNGMAFHKELYDVVLRDNPYNYMNSDEYSTRLLLFAASKVAIAKGVYTYYQFSGSITHKYTPKLFELLLVDSQLVDFSSYNYGEDLASSVSTVMASHLISLQKKYWLGRGNFTNKEKETIEKILSETFSKVQLRKRILPFKQRLMLLNPTLFKMWSKIKA